MHSQSALFLLISPSLTHNGMGGSGVSLPSSSAASTYYNPGAIAFLSEPGINFSYQSSHTPWLPGLVDDMWIDYRASMIQIRLPLTSEQQLIQANTLSFCTSRTYLDAGLQQYTGANGDDLGTFRTYFLSENASLSVGLSTRVFRIPVETGIGLTYKQIFQHLTSNQDGKAQNTAFDWGFLSRTTLPLKMAQHGIGGILEISPSLGYSVSNIGAEVIFRSSEQADPLPRTARFGVSLELNLMDSHLLYPMSFSVSRSAEDLLINQSASSWKYTKGLGDINFINHVIRQSASDDVIVKSGWELGIAETFWLRSGKYADLAGKVNYTTIGIEVALIGIIPRDPGATYEENSIARLQHFVDLSYVYSSYVGISDFHPLHGTRFQGFELSVKHFDELMGGISPKK